MKKTDFLKELKEALEIEDFEILESTILTDIPEYDSMSVIIIIAFVDEFFEVQLTAKQLNSLRTVEELMTAIGNERFE